MPSLREHGQFFAGPYALSRWECLMPGGHPVGMKMREWRGMLGGARSRGPGPSPRWCCEPVWECGPGVPRHPVLLPARPGRRSTPSRISERRAPCATVTRREERVMDVMHERCAGLDIHKRQIVACRVTPGAAGAPTKVVRTFGTMTADLVALADWLAEAGGDPRGDGIDGGVLEAALQPAGGPLYAAALQCPALKAVPGRKTDVKDSEWIADLLRHGLLRGSFVPRAGAAGAARVDALSDDADPRADGGARTGCRRRWKGRTSSSAAWRRTCWASRDAPWWRR